MSILTMRTVGTFFCGVFLAGVLLPVLGVSAHAMSSDGQVDVRPAGLAGEGLMPEGRQLMHPVRDRLIERTGREGLPDVVAIYPHFDNTDIDSDIEAWINHIVSSFERDLAFAFAQTDGQGVDTCSLSCAYKLSWPSSSAVSITFELWIDTGGEHPGQDVITMNYSLLTGQRLTLVDLFEDEESALTLLSAVTRRHLAVSIGGGMETQRICEGTAPVMDNFSSLTLTPAGIAVNFQTYQVAPWSAGVQRVDVPLEALMAARPLLSIWGR